MSGSTILGSSWRVVVAALLIFGLLMFAARLGNDAERDHATGGERPGHVTKRQ